LKRKENKKGTINKQQNELVKRYEEIYFQFVKKSGVSHKLLVILLSITYYQIIAKRQKLLISLFTLMTLKIRKDFFNISESFEIDEVKSFILTKQVQCENANLICTRHHFSYSKRTFNFFIRNF